jgi:hypothetical protein
MSQALAQVLVLVRQVAPDGPWSRAVSPMHPDPGVAHPSCGRVLEAVALVVRNWCRMRREDLAKPRLQGRLHPPADGQHQQPRPEAFRRVASACSGQHLRVWPEATPTFRSKADATRNTAAKDYTKLPCETKLYVIESDDINAEALPAGYLCDTKSRQ